MPRGIKGSGPYSKYKTEPGEVGNDLAAPLRKKVTIKAATPAKKAPAKKAVTKAPAKKVLPKKSPSEKFTRVSSGNGHAVVKNAVNVNIDPSGELIFTDESGKKQTITLQPHLLLDLEKATKEAADVYVRRLVDSRK